MSKHNTRLSVSWAPRDVNQEADDLSNGKFDGFDPALRVPLDLATITWELLPQLLRDGEVFYTELALVRAAQPQGNASKKQKKEEALRVRDPW